MRGAREEAFSLTEILIVIAVLGILVAITVPVFSTAPQRARESAAKADLLRVANEILAMRFDNSGTITASVGTPSGPVVLTNDVGQSVRIKLSNGVIAPTARFTSGLGSVDAWCVSLQAAPSGRVFAYSRSRGLIEGGC